MWEVSMMGFGDYPAELITDVNERPLLKRPPQTPPLLVFGLPKEWTKPALGLLIAIGLAYLLIAVNSLVGPMDPALQDVGQIVGP